MDNTTLGLVLLCGLTGVPFAVGVAVGMATERRRAAVGSGWFIPDFIRGLLDRMDG